MSATITIEIDQLKAIISGCVKDVLRDHGVTDRTYPLQMTKAQICEMKGCSEQTFYINRKAWGIKKLGKDRYCGLSVKRHIEKMNEEKKGKF